MLEIIKLSLQGFWHFCGVFALLNLVLYFLVNGLCKIWVRFMRYLMVSKHGWPPSHLDADGDWKPEPEYEGN